MPHSVQLFDSGESRARAVATFVRVGLDAGERVIVVMRAEAWSAAAAALARQEVALDAAIASGSLIVLDAVTTLARLREDGRLDQARFDAVAGELVTAAAADGRRVRVYGEVVDLLASEGDFAGARELEAMWNRLRERVRFALFCGYASVHFAEPPGTFSLRAIRDLHTHAHLDSDDIVGTHLMQGAGAV